MAPPSELSRAIHAGQWNLVVKYADSLPELTTQWSKRDALFDGKTAAKVLPLHEAIVAKAPLKVIQALVKAHPSSLYKAESSFGRLPLHCATRKACDAKTIEFLVKRASGACLEADNLQRLPLHYALTNGANPNVIDILMKAQPSAARGVDKHGWTPVHIAMSVGASEEVVQRLLQANPESVLMRTNRGASLRGCIPNGVSHADILRELANDTNNEVRSKVHLPSMRKQSLRVERMVMA